jgi:hypothetical protein
VKPGWLRFFANGVLALSAADVLCSLLDEAVRAATGSAFLEPSRNALAQLALLWVVASVPGMLVTPRLPIPVFVPLAIVTVWLGFGMAPLPLWIASPRALSTTGVAIQLAAVALAFAVVRARNGGRSFWFGAASPERPAFAWRHSLAFGAGLFTIGPIAAVGYTAIALATSIQVVTGGFVHFDLTGVSLGDRHYRRGDREIRLVGMMHVGDPAGYRALVSTFERESTIVLAEGVSDREGRLAASLQYGQVAEAIGLAQQQDLRSYLVDAGDGDAKPPDWPVVRHADVDASAFSPATIEMLRWAGQVWSAKDLASALELVLHAARESTPEQGQAFFADVLDRRNEHLVQEIERALGEYEHVVVPWGALHLPGIERTVMDWGYEETSRELHPLFAWRTVIAAVL